MTGHNDDGEFAMVAVYSQADAKSDLFKICRAVRDEAKIVCVKDKAEHRFMTICPNDRRIEGPTVNVPVTRFKGEFSKFSILVRLGISFRVSMKNGDVFIRKNTGYMDPLQDILVRWQDMVAAQAIEAFESSELRREIRELKREQGEISEDMRRVILGVARISIGHKPFAEGEIDA
jgi:hypothetical protein